MIDSFYYLEIAYQQNSPAWDTHMGSEQKKCYKCTKDLALELTICPYCQANFILNDCYEILSEIGSGSQSIVLKAKDLKTGNPIALKVFRKDWTSMDGIQLVEREFNILKQLDSPYIIKAFTMGQIDSSFEYIAVEYFPGEPVGDRINRSGVFDMLTGMALALQACEAISEFHRHGIIHRDLKLNNVLVNEANEIKFIDLGVCSRGDNQLGTHLYFIGTPEYAAPEQFLCQGVDNRTDIYSFGIVLFFLFTGHYPFTVNEPSQGQQTRIMTFKELHTKQSCPPPSKFNPHIKPRLESVITNCLRKQPKDRYQTIEEVANDLKQAHEEYYENTPSKPLTSRPPRSCQHDETELLGDDTEVGKTATDSLSTHKYSLKPGAFSHQLNTPASTIQKFGGVLRLGALGTAIAMLILFFLLESGLLSRLGYFHVVDSTRIITPQIQILTEKTSDLEIYTDAEGTLLGMLRNTSQGKEALAATTIYPEFTLPENLISQEAFLVDRSDQTEYPLRNGLSFPLFHALLLKNLERPLEYCLNREVKNCIRLDRSLNIKRFNLKSHQLKEIIIQPAPFQIKSSIEAISIIPVPFVKSSQTSVQLLNEKNQPIAHEPIQFANDSMRNTLLLREFIHRSAEKIIASFTDSTEIVPLCNLKVITTFASKNQAVNLELENIQITPQAWLKPDWKLTPNQISLNWIGPKSGVASIEMNASGVGIGAKTIEHSQNIDGYIFQRESYSLTRKKGTSLIYSLKFSLYRDEINAVNQIFEQKLLELNFPFDGKSKFMLEHQQISATHLPPLMLWLFRPGFVLLTCNQKHLFAKKQSSQLTLEINNLLKQNQKKIKKNRRSFPQRLKFALLVDDFPLAIFQLQKSKAPFSRTIPRKVCDQNMIQIPAPGHDTKKICIDKYEFSVEKCRQLAPTCHFFRNHQKNGSKEDAFAYVTFSEARKYCKLRGQRLPSIAEWQEAASDLPSGLSRFHVSSPKQKQRKALQINQLGRDKSSLGVFGLGGNLSEWAVGSKDQPYVCGKGFDNWVNNSKELSKCRKFSGEPGLSRTKGLGFRCVKDIR